MTGYPPPPPSFPPPSPYPPPAFPPAGGAAYLPGAGYGVTHSRPTDVMGRRIGAYAIDLAIAFVIFMVMFFALASTSDFNSTAAATRFCDSLNDNPDLICTSSGTTAFVIDSTEVEAILLAELGFFVVNFVLLTGLTGFSLGKLMTGIRVVHQQTGQRCGVLRAFLRTVLLVVPDLFGAVGVIVAASSSDHRRVGDMGASTLVVHKHALGQPLPRAGYAPMIYAPGGYPGSAATPAPGYGYPGAATPAPGYGYPGAATPAPGYGYPPAQPPWPPSPAEAPPSGWTAPAAPAPVVPPASSWPDFEAPPDPDATSVFDTSSPTDTNIAVGESVAATDAAAETQAPPAPADESEPAPGVGAPHWDAERNTYVQWDPELNAWMQWDYAKSEWLGMN